MSRDTLGPAVGAPSTGLATYNAAALASATTVIGHYSTSFGLAARLLAPGVREEVRTIYALVRIADEIVDGAAAEAGIDLAGQRELLDDLEHAWLLKKPRDPGSERSQIQYRSMSCRFEPNLEIPEEIQRAPEALAPKRQ